MQSNFLSKIAQSGNEQYTLDTARYVTLSLTTKNATYGNFGNMVTYFPVFPLKKYITWVILAFW